MSDENYAKLVLNRNGIQVLGEGTIDCAIHTKMIEALLKLPTTGKMSVKSIVDRFSSRTKRSFDAIIKLDTPLREAFEKLPMGHSINVEDVVREFILGQNPIAVVIFMRDGRRFVSRETRKYDNLDTLEEFENKTGLSVLEWIRKDANKMVEKVKQLIALLEGEPVDYLVTVTSQEGDTISTQTLKITVYAESEVYAYAQRHNLSVMDITPEKKV